MSLNGIVPSSKSRHWQTAIAALLSTSTIAAAAQQAGISERTMHRLLLKSEFKAQLLIAKNAIMDSAINKLKAAAVGAVGTLVEISDAGHELASSRVSAAKAIIELALRAGTLEDINRRLSELETAAEGE